MFASVQHIDAKEMSRFVSRCYSEVGILTFDFAAMDPLESDYEVLRSLLARSMDLRASCQRLNFEGMANAVNQSIHLLRQLLINAVNYGESTRQAFYETLDEVFFQLSLIENA